MLPACGGRCDRRKLAALRYVQRWGGPTRAECAFGWEDHRTHKGKQAMAVPYLCCDREVAFPGLLPFLYRLARAEPYQRLGWPVGVVVPPALAAIRGGMAV